MKTLAWLTAGVGIGLAAYLIMNAPEPQYSTGYDDVEGAARRTSGWGSKQRLSGAGSDLLGRVKEGVGNLAGNDRLASEGVADQVSGKVQSGAGKFAEAAGQTLHDLNR